MAAESTDRVFSSSVSDIYERYMVPLIFESYAADLTRRLVALRPARVLELAAGTGAVTRAMAAALPAGAAIVATDLNQTMLDTARAVGTARPVEWRQADAANLPFGEGEFDAVVCQFGVMFLPDRPKAFAGLRRVLKPGGSLMFNVWDRIGENEFAAAIAKALEAEFPRNPPRFMERTPHGYHDRDRILADVAAGGFTGELEFETLPHRSRADTPHAVAFAYCHGTPWRGEIEAQGAGSLERATQAAEAAIVAQFGPGPVDGKIQAHVIRATRPR